MEECTYHICEVRATKICSTVWMNSCGSQMKPIYMPRYTISKMAGQDNWKKYDQVIAKIDSARAAGLNITTDMYTYTAGATGLDASMPPWVQEGGYDKWAERLQDPAIRKRVYKEMTTPSDEWENLMLATASYEDIILIGFNNDELTNH